MNHSAKKMFGLFSLFSVLSMATASNLYGQISNEINRIETNLVLVDVLVTDNTGKAVRGLRTDQFELFIDDSKQSIESFSDESAPISFGIVFDMHPTTADRTRSVIEALKELKRGLGAQDDIFLLAFNMRGQQIFDFIPTNEQLERYMADPDRREPYALYDAVYFASDKIKTRRNQKRVLLIISDSADHHSRNTYSDIERKLATIKTEVYAIIVDNNNDLGYKDITHHGRDTYPFLTDASSFDRAALLDLTLKSGGSTYFGGSKNTDQLQRIYKEIAGEMRSHYTLGFYPNVVDSKRHSIKVRLRGVAKSKDFSLAYRMNYQNVIKHADN